jgi:dTDP-glucose 4,6-dehydratase
MATWLVTGGAGFIGCNFVRAALAKTDARVVVLDKLTYAGNLENLADLAAGHRFAFVRADIADREAVAAAFREHAPTAVINFAAETHVDRSIDDPAAFVRTNVLGTFELLEASRRHLEACDEAARRRFRFLHVSTDEVYGSLGPSGAFAETTPYQPNSPYSATKAGADHLVHAYHATYGVPALITNCSNNYGPHQFPEKLIPLMILNALEGKPLPIYGDGRNVRDWLYVEDHCDAIWAVLQRGEDGRTYNVGGNSERSNVELVDALCREVAAQTGADVGELLALKQFVTDRPGHDFRYAIDASRIRDELGFKPAHDLDSGLRATVRWYLENDAWVRDVRSGEYRRWIAQHYGDSSDG